MEIKKFKIITVLIYLILLSVLISLGMWQLRRFEEKSNLLFQQDRFVATQKVDLKTVQDIDQGLIRFLGVVANGYYDSDHQFLLDNQIKNGRAGYFVLTPFVMELNNKKAAVLVNRGWVSLGKDRSTLPNLIVGNERRTISGRINNFPSVGIKLSGAEVPTEGWPSVVELIDSNILAKKLGYSLLKFQIELDKGLSDGFDREWVLRTSFMKPEQHMAYAVQWFGLAFAVLVFGIWANIRKA